MMIIAIAFRCKNKKVPLKAMKTFKRKRVGQIDLFRIMNSLSDPELIGKAYCNFKFPQDSQSKDIQLGS